jgi:hypothetical protein
MLKHEKITPALMICKINLTQIEMSIDSNKSVTEIMKKYNPINLDDLESCFETKENKEKAVALYKEFIKQKKYW